MRREPNRCIGKSLPKAGPRRRLASARCCPRARRVTTEAAVEWIQKSIDRIRIYAAAYSNLGLALQKLDKPEQALSSYHRALALKPDYVEVLNNIGNALLQLGVRARRWAVMNVLFSLKPNYAEALYNRGKHRAT